jgi:hypothetical protein
MKYSLRSLMRFSLRDLFWLTVVVALAVGWWIDHRRWVPAALTLSEARELERKSKYLEEEIYRIDKQLAEHGLQLEQKFSWGMGGRKQGYIEVIPLPNSQAPAQNSPKD